MIFSSDLGVPEGPVLLPDESWLVVEMSPDRGCITHISEDGKTKKVIKKTGRPNGLAVDRNGFIWVAESQPPSLIRLTMDGQADVFMNNCNGDPFLFPNDLVFGPEGNLYLTDSGITFQDFAPGGKIRDDYMEAPIDGKVYRIDISTKEIITIDSGIRFTNGLAFGPDDYLYVNETLTGMVFRYKWEQGTISGRREEFGNVIDPDGPDVFRGPDGMKFGKDGNLYVTVFGQGDVTVLGRNGEVVNRIKTEGSMPTNCAFGLQGTKKLFITEDERGNMEVVDVDTDGFKLYSGK